MEYEKLRGPFDFEYAVEKCFIPGLWLINFSQVVFQGNDTSLLDETHILEIAKLFDSSVTLGKYIN